MKLARELLLLYFVKITTVLSKPSNAPLVTSTGCPTTRKSQVTVVVSSTDPIVCVRLRQCPTIVWFHFASARTDIVGPPPGTGVLRGAATQTKTSSEQRTLSAIFAKKSDRKTGKNPINLKPRSQVHKAVQKMSWGCALGLCGPY